MKNFFTALIFLKIGFLLGAVAVLYLTKSKLMIDIGIEKDVEDDEEESEVEAEDEQN